MGACCGTAIAPLRSTSRFKQEKGGARSKQVEGVLPTRTRSSERSSCNASVTITQHQNQRPTTSRPTPRFLAVDSTSYLQSSEWVGPYSFTASLLAIRGVMDRPLESRVERRASLVTADTPFVVGQQSEVSRRALSQIPVSLSVAVSPEERGATSDIDVVLSVDL